MHVHSRGSCSKSAVLLQHRMGIKSSDAQARLPMSLPVIRAWSAAPVLTPCACGQAARAAGGNPYPHKFHTTVLLPAYVAKYAALQPGEQHASETVAIAGAALADMSAMAVLVAGSAGSTEAAEELRSCITCVLYATVQVLCPLQGVHTMTYQC